MHGEDPDCSGARTLLTIAAWSVLILVCSSFYSFIPLVDLLSLSPLLRQIHQVTRYFYVGSNPPRMLYMTDGGVKDCTAIVQLFMRRRERILLVLAGADPDDELEILKKGLE